jgi:subtilisin family serine protease
MSKKNCLIFLISSLLLIAGDINALYRGEKSASPRPHAKRLIVKFKDAASKITAADIDRSVFNDPAVMSLNKCFGVVNSEPLLKPKSIRDSNPSFKNIFILMISRDDIDIDDMLAAYQALPEVEYAEPDYMAEFYELPNDSLFSHQWGLSNTGQGHYHIQRYDGSYNDELIIVNGVADADIDLDDVYQTPPDKTGAAIIAIIDTGADLLHPDLAANIWTNAGEIADNGLDDDNNGYIDDIHGWDFCGASGLGSLDSDGDNDPTDEEGHGTHCAGIAAGVSGNGIGIAGVNGAAKIMPLKISPLPLTSFVAAALIYAADNGADVVSMSFGFTFRAHLLEEALAYAKEKGAILVAAAGNDFTEQINYPAGYGSVMAVGASTDSDQVATFSTFGDHIDVVAPGHSILSLRADGTDMYASEYPREPNVHIIDNIYYLASGTSMACPHVAGIAAWLKGISPGLNPDTAEAIINYSADDILDPYGVGWSLPGRDKYSGYGRANLYDALKITSHNAAAIDSPRAFQILSGAVDIIGSAYGEEFGGYILDYGEGFQPTVWKEISFSSLAIVEGVLGQWNTIGLLGTYTLRLRVGDKNMACRSVYVVNDTVATILFPQANDTLSSSLAINASAYCPDFGYLTLELGSGYAPSEWDTLALITHPVFQADLATMTVEEIPGGEYTLKLSLHSKTGLAGEFSIPIYIASIFDSDRAWKVKLEDDPSIIANYGDFDDDGKFEIVVGTSTGVDFYNPDGTIKTDGVPAFPYNNFAVPPAVGDLDDDDIDDIVAIGYDPPKLYGFPSSGPRFENYLGVLPNVDNNLQMESDLPKVFLKDIDNDGRDEIHVVLPDYTMAQIMIFDSDGSLLKEFRYNGVYMPADIDGDGVDELYFCREDYGLLKIVDAFDFETRDSLIIQAEGSIFRCYDLTACDIDGDEKLELMAYGLYSNSGYWLYAFNENLETAPGWPKSLGADEFVVPTNPVFGDIDADGELEYLTTYFDLGTSYILAWRADGSSYLPGSGSGLFAVVPGSSILNMLLLADMNGDEYPEVVACAINDMFLNYPVQRIYAWDKNGEALDGYPLIGEMGNSTYLRYTPTIGDIDADGDVDMVMTTADSSLVFFSFPGNEYNPCFSPVPFWRYGRAMNNLGQRPELCDQTKFEADDNFAEEYALNQNYPNPFNKMTKIEYNLPRASDVTITIYNMLGQRVRTAVNGHNPAGRHQFYWDGKDDKEREVASGLYFYKISAEGGTLSKKMLMLK